MLGGRLRNLLAHSRLGTRGEVTARARPAAGGICAQVSAQAPTINEKFKGGINKNEKVTVNKNEKVKETPNKESEEQPSKDRMPEFMTKEMREKISRTVLRKEHEECVCSIHLG